KDRLFLGDAFNLGTLSGLLRFLKKMFRGTFTIEAIGALLYSFAFVPEYGLRGIWISVFTAVSAFCNAGIDIIGPQSLIPYADNPLVVLTTSMLIIFGGLGFLVWWDIADTVRKKPPLRQLFRRLKLHSKIVLISTASLLFGGTAVILLLEYSNPETLAAMPFGQKLLSAFFQSVTLRTAGFMTVSQSSLREATSLFSIILMFIGGSPIGTAGGIKTTTAATLIIAARSYAKGKRSATAFKRTLPNETIIKALTVVLISTAAAFIAVLLLSATQEGSIIDIAYEAVSALGTVGLTRSLTPSLDTFGKIVIIICMYLGRVGPISLVIALSGNRNPTYTVLPEEDVRVG
ncbi:MAG: potassium transporter KtrB, partial [Clostridia bacterium]|nr:potassium transporter KtrB [Clostridia bacterium]